MHIFATSKRHFMKINNFNTQYWWRLRYNIGGQTFCEVK